MTAIASREDKLGNLVKFETNTAHGYCRETKTVQLTPTSAIGDVLYDDSGDLKLIAVANTANIEAILVDTSVYTLRPAAGTVDVALAVLVRGPAIIADKAINYNVDVNTAAEILAVHTKLATLGILVRAQY